MQKASEDLRFQKPQPTLVAFNLDNEISEFFCTENQLLRHVRGDPNTTSRANNFCLVNYILNVMRAHSSWSARKIRIIRRFSGIKIPAKSRIHEMLDRQPVV